VTRAWGTRTNASDLPILLCGLRRHHVESIPSNRPFKSSILLESSKAL
jgi:hypothetical protein